MIDERKKKANEFTFKTLLEDDLCFGIDRTEKRKDAKNREEKKKKKNRMEHGQTLTVRKKTEKAIAYLRFKKKGEGLLELSMGMVLFGQDSSIDFKEDFY